MTLALQQSQSAEIVSLRRALERACGERDEALERVRQLEALARELDGARVPDFDITHTQDLMLRALLRWKLVSRSQMMALLYGDRLDPPDPKVIDALMCKLRRRLTPYGITITCARGHGWALDEASRAKLKGQP